MKIALTTGGGDAPGLNAVIRAVTLAALGRGFEAWGISHGYGGLLEPMDDALVRLDRTRVRGIAHLGGTILGTSSRGNPFSYPRDAAGRPSATPLDRSADLLRRLREEGFDAMIAVGGDGSMRIAKRLLDAGGPRTVGVPKTIDNDVKGTDATFGFDSAVAIATDAIDRLHTTAEAHDRVLVVEVMGRNAGWIALRSGLAGGADVILIPEVPYRIDAVVEKIAQRDAMRRHFSIVVAAEGAKAEGEDDCVVQSAGDPFRAARLGGVADQVARELASRTGKDTRSLVLGHLQRGGGPTNYDRLLGLRFGAAAVRFLAAGCDSGMVALQGAGVEMVSLDVATSGTKTVPLDTDSLLTAREMGIAFGDEPAGHFASS